MQSVTAVYSLALALHAGVWLLLQGEELFDTVSGRQSTISSVGGRDPLHEELKYMRTGEESFGGTLTPTGDDSDLRHRSYTPSLFIYLL